MRAYPVPENESARVAALHALEILGSGRDPAFDALVALACALFKVPIALVSLLDENQQWFKAAQGIDHCTTEREVAFCNYPVASGKMFVVNDATSDPRFNRNRLVVGEPFIRFYAGIPLTLNTDVFIGTLCILDTVPRQLGPSDSVQLQHLAEVATALIRQHRDTRDFLRLAYEWEEHRRSNHELTESLVRYKTLFDSASSVAKIGAWEWVMDGDQLTWTDGMYDIHEMPRGSPMTSALALDFYPPGPREEVQRLNAPTSDPRAYRFEGPLTTGKGNKRWVRVTGGAECKDGAVVRRYGIKQDITEQKVISDQMQFLAECDPLTGLSNRSSFQKRLRGALKDERRPVLLMLIDVDEFKHINDTFGHPVGDECLKQLAKRLRDISEGAELVTRLGGDEFALLITASLEDAAVCELAEKILIDLRRPIRWRGQSFQLSGSIGIASSRIANHQPAHLLSEADLALYAAKKAGRNTFRIFSPEMKKSAEARFAVVRNISSALEQGQLELFYQPKVRLQDDRLQGFEALLRWRRADGKVVPAGEFPAALEDPRLSERIGDWVIETALCQARTWLQAGLQFGHIALNLSSTQFYRAGFADWLTRAIAEHGLRPGMIEVEVTEGVFLGHETDVVKDTLATLKKAGIRIALDDFGTGFASLTHLRTYPVDIIKIDRSFVRDLLTAPQDHVILQSLLFLGRHLQLDVVAEGIETDGQREFLKALGCTYGQGYLFSKAVCASEAVEWCRIVSAPALQAV